MINDEIWREKRYDLPPGFILRFIKESTTMNEEEYKNWRKIRQVLKSDPNFISKYLKMLSAGIPAEINKGVKNIMTKSNNQNLEKIIGLLTKSGAKIVNLIADGVPRTELANNLGITEPSLCTSLCDVYRRTSSVIKYGSKNKFADLSAYIFAAESACTVNISKNDCGTQVENSVQVKMKVSEEISAAIEKRETSAVEVPFELQSPSETLQYTADLLRREYTEMCTMLGQFVIDDAFNPCAVVNGKAKQLLTKARKYQSAIDVINDVISDMAKGKEVQNA